MLARIASASLVQVNGRGWSFQWSAKAPMAAVSSSTEVKVPRRMAWRVMTEKKHSTRLSQEQLVGTKCKVIGWLAAECPRVRNRDCQRQLRTEHRQPPVLLLGRSVGADAAPGQPHGKVSPER